jgi:hypothetical protein
VTNARWVDPEDGEVIEPQKYDAVGDTAVLFFTFVRLIIQAFSRTARSADNLARAHSNYRRNRAEWAASVLEDINTIPGRD